MRMPGLYEEYMGFYLNQTICIYGLICILLFRILLLRIIPIDL